MLIRIPTDAARIDMFVDSIEGNWLDHSLLLSRRFRINARRLEKLRSSKVDYIVIDDERGAGVPTDDAALPPPVPNAAPAPVRVPAKASATGMAEPIVPSRLTGTARQAEIRRATPTLRQSKHAVTGLFGDARLGKKMKVERVAPLVEKITTSVATDPSVILAIARLKTKDEYTYLHSVAVCALMLNLARTLVLPEQMMPAIGMAGLLHDVGKMAIPEAILAKPGALTAEEYTLVQSHSRAGFDLLTASDAVPELVLNACLHHHEKVDGSGYPNRLTGDSISQIARMAAVCDVYDALTSQRSYNEPLPPAQALALMQSWHGHFDQLILRAFIDSLGILPLGTLVRLHSDRLAPVAGEGVQGDDRPLLRVFHSARDQAPIPAFDLDLSAWGCTDAIASVENPAHWGFDDWTVQRSQVLKIAA